MDAAAVRRGPRVAGVAYALLLTVCAGFTLAWLALGAAVAIAAHVAPVAAGLTAAAAAGNAWARGVLGAIPRSEPAAQVLIDSVLSLAGIGVAAALLASRRSGWPGRLLALALVASAGAFNLQAQAAATTVRLATGVAAGGVHQVLLHGVACAAYVAALVVFPSRAVGGRGRGVLVAVGAGTLVVVGTATALLAHTLTCVIFFGVGIPVAGIALLPGRIRSGSTVAERTQGRLLFSVMMAALVVVVALASITVLLASLGWDGLTLVDPTTPTASTLKIGGGQPIALLFWYSRLACIAIAAAVLVATRSAALWSTERWFSRGLVVLLVSGLIGGCYFVIDTVADVVLGPAREAAAVGVTALATVTAAVAFRPVHRHAERLVDRVLYGSRPTPYSVLADITALSTSSPADAPDLERVAEAVGRGLSATTCRLTVVRPGLRDRTYTWAKRRAHASDELVEVPIRHGDVPIGAIAVDRAAVAGLQAQRRRLLEDIADSLGAVLQTSRLGIELERQLRAALAHAAEIAGARRSAVAEMDRERRRIERDLHDGAQHHLVSLRLTLGLVEHQVSTGRLEQVRDQLDQVVRQIDMAESVLAETAAGVSSPLLAQRGLVGALGTELAAGQPPVVLDAAGVAPGARFPADVEAATWFCCLEAVNNARKHAPGAAIGVRLSVAGGVLHLCVRDDGPGWDADAAPSSPGQGMRNVATRIGAVGGRVQVRSAPGAGTTVECSVPVPTAPARPAPVADRGPAVPARGPAGPGRGPADPGRRPADPTRGPADPARGPATTDRSPTVPTRRPASPARRPADAVPGPRPVTAGGHRAPLPAGLLDRVRHAAQVAADLYRGTPQAGPLRQVLHRLDGPLRVAVVGPRGVATSPLVDALRQHAAASGPAGADSPAITLVDPAPHPTGDAVDAVLLLLHRGPDGATPPAAPRIARDGGPRTIRVLVPAGGAAGRVPAPRPPGSSSAVLTAAQPVRGDLGALHELVEARFVRCADALKARSALRALEGILGADPPRRGGGPLAYLLERIRSEAHELTEMDLVDALEAGERDLPDGERAAAARVLGGAGTDPRTRLSLPPDAGPGELARAAAQQLAHWQRRARHPAATADARAVGSAVVRTCEQVLAGAGGATASPKLADKS